MNPHCLKKTTPLRPLFPCLAALASAVCVPMHAMADETAGRWSAEKAHAWYDAQPWLVGCNFTPSTAVNQLEMWQADSFDPETIDRELGLAAGLGMNTVRTYLHDLAWQADPVGFKQRLDQFLDIAAKYGIRPMLVFFDDCWNPDPKIGKQPDPVPGVHNSGWVQSPGPAVVNDPARWGRLEAYVKDIVGTFREDERILIWDVYNEPGNTNQGDRSLPLLVKAFEWARAMEPVQPLTAAVWGFLEDRPAIHTYLAEASDIISLHHYRDLESLKTKVEALRRHGRPIISSEWLARGHSNVADQLPYYHAERIGVYNWGLVAGKTNTIYRWGSKEGSPEPELWHHDLLRKDGSPFDPAEAALFHNLSKKPAAASGYASDLAFIRGHTPIIELRSGESRVALAPAWQGRVMTSTPGGALARAMGFVHRPGVEAGIKPEAERTGLDKHIHIFGGEERFWLGPEGGPYSLFFPPGVPQEFAHWKTPALIDTEPFDVESQTETKAVFTKSATLKNRAGSTLEMDIRREVKVLDSAAITHLLGTAPGDGVRPVAYRSTNTVTNRGPHAWTKESGLPSIWMLGMFPPTPQTTIVIPLNPASDAEPNTRYTGFGPIPEDRVKVVGNHLFFKGDGQSRGKLGVPPARAMPFSGAWQADTGVLTLLHTPLPEDIADLPYVDSQWKDDGDPYAGDVINSYNDGPPEPGADPLGPFWELETSSPALALAPGDSHTHQQTTLHLTGPRAALDAIANAVLGISLDEVEKALP